MLEHQFQELLDPKDPLLNWRKKHWDRFQEIGWPKEAFQYIPLKTLSIPKAAEPSAVSLGTDRPFQIAFADGFFSTEYSRVPEGVVCLPLDEAMRSYGVFLQNRILRTLKEESDPFAALNGAFQGRGCFLYAPPQMRRAEPIFIRQFFSAERMATPRLMVYLGRQSRLELIQRLDGAYFCNAQTDAVVDEGAELVFLDALGASETSHVFHAIRASLKRDSRFAAHLYSEGAALARTSIKVQLLEENGEALLQGLARLDGALQNHIHALVEHLAPRTRSRQHFKGILKGKSCSSFEGKIYVHPLAQKTEAYQLNNHLLLSDQAQAYAKPNLEIFADDVQASHGATVSQLDAEDLFYLRSRGLPREEAQNRLIEGFCRELIHCIPEEKR